eukprot:TRINITY_DN65160_c0_g1_i1.p1 TRINITY_DN65160_c0_g1~~TRINITY_DN65160_c0_g1_i1.p1  ORF type:complete len:100 (+),score=0.63 TRINITY_DN65160_c0_g1_i1:71-370(+)
MACARSSSKSSMYSIPTDNRINPAASPCMTVTHHPHPPYPTVFLNNLSLCTTRALTTAQPISAEITVPRDPRGPPLALYAVHTPPLTRRSQPGLSLIHI